MKALINVLKLKSMTVNFNALYMALIAVLEACGVKVAPELAAAGQTIMNFGLRAITTKPLSEK